VLAFVESNNELAKSMVGKLLEETGIKGSSGQKQHDVRKLLVDKGLLLKQKNYFSDKTTGYRHGNFYICGAVHDWLDFVMECRRLACDQGYRERLRQLNMLFSRAA